MICSSGFGKPPGQFSWGQHWPATVTREQIAGNWAYDGHLQVIHCNLLHFKVHKEHQGLAVVYLAR